MDALSAVLRRLIVSWFCDLHNLASGMDWRLWLESLVAPAATLELMARDRRNWRVLMEEIPDCFPWDGEHPPYRFYAHGTRWLAFADPGPGTDASMRAIAMALRSRRGKVVKTAL